MSGSVRRARLLALAASLTAASCQDPQRTCTPREPVWFTEGTAPLLITVTHAGEDDGDGCGPALAKRKCSAALSDACASGPCLAGRSDTGLREMAFAVIDSFTACFGEAPTLVMLETHRNRVDVNRDMNDPGGALCAYEDARAAASWRAFHDAMAGVTATAARDAGALLVDLHTYGTIDAAPPPAVIIGSGDPIGSTLPRRSAVDVTLPLLFGPAGLAAELTRQLRSIDDVTVLPARADEVVGTLYAGRHVIHSAAARVDALQLEVSDRLRQDAVPVGAAIGTALCHALRAEGARAP